MNEILKLPLWKNCLEKMRVGGLDYGQEWPASFFETEMCSKSESPQFQFEMLELKRALEDDDGYYLQQINGGKAWSIPLAAEHEDVARGWERKLRRYAVRSIAIRAATLTNPKASLSGDDRKKMEASLERASIRLCLISRQQSVAKIILKNSPKLLKESAS